MPDTAVTAVAHVVQLAVAPVFLLSGIGAMLAVMTQRLSRVVDRARVLENLLTDKPAETPAIHAELGTLSRRAKLISSAVTLCTTTALLICAVIAILFIGASLDFHTAIPVVILFVLAMLTFFTGLLAFLREVLLATATLRIGPQIKDSSA